MRISDWSSDVCSSDLSQVAVDQLRQRLAAAEQVLGRPALGDQQAQRLAVDRGAAGGPQDGGGRGQAVAGGGEVGAEPCPEAVAEADHLARSEEHTSEIQSLMRISYADFCLKKKIQ